MSFFNSDPDLAPYHLCDAFRWDDVRQFVDLGGSLGSTAVALAERNPQLTCIIQDQAGLAKEAELSIPNTLKDRVTFMEHSFFDDQPESSANTDVFHFRWIFHNWSDEYCARILKALIPALKSGARVIVSDFVIPAFGTASPYAEYLTRAFDLAMLELFNSKEREPDDWLNLFAIADSRFKVTEIKQPATCKLAFIEAVWMG
jgi:hypothetical protein